VIITALVVGALSLAAWMWRPLLLMLPKATIKNYISRELPIGTEKESVLRFVRAHGFTVAAEVDTSNARFLRVHLGGYRRVFRTDVVAFIHLDRADKVTAIDVQKHTDSL
jgi:hypothetical protein